MKTELIKLIEGGLNKNTDKVKSYALLIADKMEKDGEKRFADRIKEIIAKSSAHPVYLDEFISKPVDNDSSLDMVDVEIEAKVKDSIILPEITQIKIENFLLSIKHGDKFIQMGIDLPNSILLYGPPGCGKTSVAHYIANALELPLVTAKFDALVSSLLGNTAKNISKIFKYATERPCILFLDEFDAIAKARDDKHEIGELKRVVNSLLQNIDEFSKNNILMAATNHEQMLDPAIWRRFSAIIEVPKPTEKEIEELIHQYLKAIDYNFRDDKKALKIIIKHLNGISPADIRTICYNSIKNTIVNNETILSYTRFLYNIYLYQNNLNTNLGIIKFLYESNVKQQDICNLLNISIRQVRKELNKGGSE